MKTLVTTQSIDSSPLTTTIDIDPLQEPAPRQSRLKQASIHQASIKEAKRKSGENKKAFPSDIVAGAKLESKSTSSRKRASKQKEASQQEDFTAENLALIWKDLCKMGDLSSSLRSSEGAVDPLNEYLSRLTKLRPLTNDEQMMLSDRVFHQKDNTARQILILTNLRLVVKIAREYVRPHSDLFELIQEGNVGLAVSISRFDPNRGVKFISYAQYWIRAMILNYLMNHSYPVKFGNTRAGRKLFYNLKKARADLRQKGIDRPTPTQVADYLGVEVDEVIRVSAQMDAPPVAIDATAPGYEGVTNGELMASSTPYPDAYAERNELAALLHSAFDEFDRQLVEERDRSIWYERMIADRGMTLKQLGSKWGVSKERIRQVETEIRNRFREYLVDRYGDMIEDEVRCALA